MINHLEPDALNKLASGQVDLNYIPGTSSYTNKSLGYYLFGNKWTGVKTGKGQRNKT